MSVSRLPRHFVEKPWGRDDLPSTFGQDGRRIGEVWYDLPDQPLPVLVKWLFTSERLSIQVHPSDAQAQARGLASGKEECWFVTAAEPGATLGIGTDRSLTADELRAASLSGEIEHYLDWKPVAPGDWFYIPAGTVHAIGAGVTLVEVQQNADITYRLFDYGRPRELHLDDGVAVSKAEPYRGSCGDLRAASTGEPLVTGPNFQVQLVRKGEPVSMTGSLRSLLVPLEGALRVGEAMCPVGEVVLIDGASAEPVLTDGSALLVSLDRD